MCDFYSEAVGLDESYFDEETVSYVSPGMQFTIYSSDAARIDSGEWAIQPGWGGSEPVISWSLDLDGLGFAAAIDGVQNRDAPLLHLSPRWVGYWSFPFKDPMGNTVELTYAETPPPVDAEWSANLNL